MKILARLSSVWLQNSPSPIQRQGMRPSIFIFFSLALVVIVAVLLRSYRVTEIGVSGDDNFSYWFFSMLFAEGHFTLRLEFLESPYYFYRPVIFFLYAQAVKLFDYADYSIKVFNIFADALNIILVYFIGRKIVNRVYGLLVALSYSFVPVVVLYAREELVHTASLFFVLLSVLFFLYFMDQTKNNRLWLLFFSGFSLSLAVHVHTSTILFCGGFVLMIVRDAWVGAGEDRRLLRTIFQGLFSFFAGFVLLFAMVLPFFDVLNIWTSIFLHLGKPNAVGVTWAGKLIDLMVRVKGTTNILDNLRAEAKIAPLLFLFSLNATLLMLLPWFCGVSLPGGRRLDQRRHEKKFLPFVLVFVFLLELAILVKNFSEFRWLFCLIPLLILSVYTPVYQAVRWVKHDLAAMIVLAILVVVHLVNVVPPLVSSIIRDGNVVSHFREIYMAMKNDVGLESKILFVPHPIHFSQGFRIRPYFGDNAVYYTDCREQMDDFIIRNKIKYIFFPKYPIHNTVGAASVSSETIKYSWLDSCFIRKTDVEDMKRPRIADSAWWSHKIVNAERMNEYVRRNRGGVVYTSNEGWVFRLTDGQSDGIKGSLLQNSSVGQ